jgi:hypothetical protein
MSSTSCPALVDLFQQPLPESIENHVATCARCQALLRTQRERFSASSEQPETAERVRGTDVGPARIVLVAGADSDELLTAVVAKVGDDAVTVVPVSDRVELAGEWDLLLERDILGYEAMAELWNYGQVLPEQLVDVVAELSPEGWNEFKTLLRVVVAGGERPARSHVGAEIIAGTDPRLMFQDEESERMRPYLEPNLALAGVATLGQLVAHRREELGIAADELEQVSLQRGWVEELERDALDIERVLQPTSLAALMKRLQIGASERLSQIAYTTIEGFRGQQGLHPGLAHFRQRRGYSGQPQEHDTARYVSEFLKELEKE